MTNAEVLHQVCPCDHCPSQIEIYLLRSLPVFIATIKVEHGYRMAAPQGCAPALYDIMLECWHKVNLTDNYLLSFFCFIFYCHWVSTFSHPKFCAGPNEAADLWDAAVEVGRLLHHVRLRVQGSFRLLTVVCVSGSKKQTNLCFSHHVFPAGNPEALTPTAPLQVSHPKWQTLSFRPWWPCWCWTPWWCPPW